MCALGVQALAYVSECESVKGTCVQSICEVMRVSAESARDCAKLTRIM